MISILLNYQIILFRIFLAALIGAAIGYERASNNSAAGFRTHILVAVSLASVALIQLSIADTAILLVQEVSDLQNIVSVDFGRLGAQAIAGIGFLGAGTILQMKKGVVGLTTAASVWSVAIVGLAIGMGYYVVGVSLGTVVFFTLGTMNKFSKKYIQKTISTLLDIEFLQDEALLEKMTGFFIIRNIDIQNIEVVENWSSDKSKVRYAIILDRNQNLDELKNEIYSVDTKIVSVKSYGL